MCTLNVQTTLDTYGCCYQILLIKDHYSNQHEGRHQELQFDWHGDGETVG